MKHYLWKTAAVIGGVIALAVAVHTSTDRSQEQVTQALQKADLVQCERGNKVRSWARWDSRLNSGAPALRSGVADRLFHILDCEATQRAGVNVPLSPAEQRAYIVDTIGLPLKPLP